MVNEKHLFIIVGVLVLAFVGFMVLDSSKRNGADHPIDETIPVTPGDSGSGAAQTVFLHATASGYDQETLTVKAGQSVNFKFSADPGAGCGRQVIIDKVGVNLVSRNGETVSATFTPPSPGQYAYHCGMNMFRGVLVAT